MIIDHIRNLDEFRSLFLDRPMQTEMFTFEHIVNNPHLYCFYGEKDKKLKGFIFITVDKSGHFFLSGVSVPKNLPDNRDAIIKVCDAYKQDIYADTDLKHAVFMLKLAGFKHYEGNIYVRKFKDNGKEQQST